MKHFLIVTNVGKDREYKVTDHVKNLLEQAGMTCVICEKDENKQIIREAVPKELDCAIVIGGDGSFIEVARVLEERDIPVLGINMGTLGYLTEVELNHIDEAMKVTDIYIERDFVNENNANAKVINYVFGK